MAFTLHGIHSPADVGLSENALDATPFLVETLSDKPLGLLVDLAQEKMAILETPDRLAWRRGLPFAKDGELHVFARHTDGLAYLGLGKVETTTSMRARIALPAAVPDDLARTLATKRVPPRAPRPATTTGILAIVSKAIFEREAKRGGTKRSLGDVLDIDRYISRGPALAPLREGATLVLVTVRPPSEDIWLVALLEDLNLTDDGYIAKRANLVPLTDVTTLVKEILAEAGSPLKAGKIAMSLQTPRSLEAEALKRLRSVAPRETVSTANASTEKTESEKARVVPAAIVQPEIFADPATLPRVLLVPPWTREKTRRPTTRAKEYRAALGTVPPRIVWGRHEREIALGVARTPPAWHKPRPVVTAAELLTPSAAKASLRALSTMPIEEAREGARAAPLTAFYIEPHFLLPALARLDRDAVPCVLRVGQDANHRYGTMTALAHVGTPLAVPIVMHTLTWFPSMRRAARSWLTRFADLAAPALVPLAIGVAPEALGLAEVCPYKADAVRKMALRALGVIANDDRVIAFVHEAGLDEEARVALAVHPLAGRNLPSRIPWHPGLPRANAGGAPLADDAMVTLVTLLALTDWEAPTDDVIELGTSLDIATFLDALVGDWLADGAMAHGRFTFDAACQLADGALLEKITDLIRSWRSVYRCSSSLAIAALGRAAMAQAGTLAGTRALEQLGALSMRAGSKERETAANKALKEVAGALEMGDEAIDASERSERGGAIEDARIPRLGLDRDGRMELAIGSGSGRRSLVAKLDATLTPYVFDEATKERLAELPRGARRGMRAIESEEERDAERFAVLRREAARVAEELGPRVEKWMTERRRWTVPAFRERVLQHPVLRDIAFGLVWGAYSGALQRTFRVSEDGSLADDNDEHFELDAEHLIGVAHPAELDERVLRAWGDHLSNYQIIPVFPQLATPVLRLTEDERAAEAIVRHRSKTIGYDEKMKLWSWSEERIEDAPYGTLAKRIQRHGDGGPLRALLTLDAPVANKRAIRELRVLPYTALDFEGWLPWSAVDPVSTSEVLRDLDRIG